MNDADDTRVVIPRDLVTRKADDRGRLTLGSEYANKEVSVAILAVEEGR
jgi:hypothetical protein